MAQFRWGPDVTDPNISPEAQAKLPDIMSLAEQLGITDLYGTSGRRSPEYNASVGGAVNSGHIPGNAVDVGWDKNWSPESRSSFKNALLGKGFNALDEGNHVHIDLVGGKPSIQQSQGQSSQVPQNASRASIENFIRQSQELQQPTPAAIASKYNDQYIQDLPTIMKAAGGPMSDWVRQTMQSMYKGWSDSEHEKMAQEYSKKKMGLDTNVLMSLRGEDVSNPEMFGPLAAMNVVAPEVEKPMESLSKLYNSALANKRADATLGIEQQRLGLSKDEFAQKQIMNTDTLKSSAMNREHTQSEIEKNKKYTEQTSKLMAKDMWDEYKKLDSTDLDGKKNIYNKYKNMPGIQKGTPEYEVLSGMYTDIVRAEATKKP